MEELAKMNFPFLKTITHFLPLAMATLVFVDFETTICDIDSCLLTLFAKTFPGAENVDLKQRKHCKLADNFTSHKLKAKMMKLQDQVRNQQRSTRNML